MTEPRNNERSQSIDSPAMGSESRLESSPFRRADERVLASQVAQRQQDVVAFEHNYPVLSQVLESIVAFQAELQARELTSRNQEETDQTSSLVLELDRQGQEQTRRLEIVREIIASFNSEQPVPRDAPMGGSQGSRRFPLELLDPAFIRLVYSEEQLKEIENRLAALDAVLRHDSSALLTQAMRAVESEASSLRELAERRPKESVNITNVVHIFQDLGRYHPELLNAWLAKTGFEDLESFQRIVNDPDEGAWTLERYNPSLEAYWLVHNIPGAIYNLGLTLNNFGFGPAWLKRRIVISGFEPAYAYANYHDQVRGFNNNKDFDDLPEELHPALYEGLGPNIDDESGTAIEHHLLDMANFPEFNPANDLPSVIYIAGITESTLQGYGLPGGKVRLLILQAPIDAWIKYLERMQNEGLKDLPPLGECTIDPKTGDFYIGQIKYGEAVYIPEEMGSDWHLKQGWNKLPRETRERNFQPGRCLIRITTPLHLDRGLDSKGNKLPPFSLLDSDTLVAFHQLPVTRIHIQNQPVNKLAHLPRAGFNQLMLLGQGLNEFNPVGVMRHAWRHRSLGWMGAVRETLSHLGKKLDMWRAAQSIFEGCIAVLAEDEEKRIEQWIQDRSVVVRQQFDRLLQKLEQKKAAIEQGKLSEVESISLYRSSIEVLGLPYGETTRHTTRVGYLAAATGELMRRDEQLTRLYPQLLDHGFIQRVELAGYFHDCGKAAAPLDDINKPGRPNRRELYRIDAHAIFGRALLDRQESQLLKDIAPLVGGHHEEWRGSGYPMGWRGEEIPIESRLISIADIMDATGGSGERRLYQRRLNSRLQIMRILLGYTVRLDKICQIFGCEDEQALDRLMTQEVIRPIDIPFDPDLVESKLDVLPVRVFFDLLAGLADESGGESQLKIADLRPIPDIEEEHQRDIFNYLVLPGQHMTVPFRADIDWTEDGDSHPSMTGEQKDRYARNMLQMVRHLAGFELDRRLSKNV